MSMIMSFTRNDASAKKNDSGRWITQSGAYVGAISQAVVGMTDKGSQFVEIYFKQDGGAFCISRLFLTKKDGGDAFGRQILDALMVVCGVQSCEVQEGTVSVRNNTAPNGFKKEAGYRMPALERKRVGLVLQRENRIYNGKPTYQMNLLTPFDPQTRKVAKEILENAPEAKLLDARLKNLKDRDSTGGATGEQQPSANHPAVAATTDDEIPF